MGVARVVLTCTSLVATVLDIYSDLDQAGNLINHYTEVTSQKLIYDYEKCPWRIKKRN